MNYKKEVTNVLKDLKIIDKNNKEIIVKAKYGPSKPTKIPLHLNESISFFVAIIIGDGHLKKDKFQIQLDCFDEAVIMNFKEIINKIFNRKFNATSRFEKGKKRYCLRMDSKAIFLLLNKIFRIPAGKKSNIVKIPTFIKNTNKSVKSAFLIGIMTTGGGKRRRRFGLSTSSKKLWEDLVILFKDTGIYVKTDRWIHKKYKKEYYGISFKKNLIKTIIKNCKDKKVRRVIIKARNFNLLENQS